MREIHVMDEIKESRGLAYLLGAFCLGIVVFAFERWLHRLIGDNGDEKIGPCCQPQESR